MEEGTIREREYSRGLVYKTLRHFFGQYYAGNIDSLLEYKEIKKPTASDFKNTVEDLIQKYPGKGFDRLRVSLADYTQNYKQIGGRRVWAYSLAFGVIFLAVVYFWHHQKQKKHESIIGQKAQQYLQGVIDERVQHTEEGIQVDLNDGSEFYDKLIKLKKAYNNLSSEEKELMKKKAGAIAELYASPEPENQKKAKQGLDDLLVELEKKGIKLE